MSACSNGEDSGSELAANIETAEGMIDAFYSFDASKLRPFLSEAGDAQASVITDVDTSSNDQPIGKGEFVLVACDGNDV